jgi:hypothetical protein
MFITSSSSWTESRRVSVGSQAMSRRSCGSTASSEPEAGSGTSPADRARVQSVRTFMAAGASQFGLPACPPRRCRDSSDRETVCEPTDTILINNIDASRRAARGECNQLAFMYLKEQALAVVWCRVTGRSFQGDGWTPAT